MAARDLIAWEDRHGKAAPGQWLFWASAAVAAGVIHATVAPVWQPIKWAQAAMNPDWLASILMGLGIYGGYLLGMLGVVRLLQRTRWYRRAFRSGTFAGGLLGWTIIVLGFYLATTCLIGVIWGVVLLTR